MVAASRVWLMLMAWLAQCMQLIDRSSRACIRAILSVYLSRTVVWMFSSMRYGHRDRQMARSAYLFQSYVLAQEPVSLACQNASDHNGYSHLFVLLKDLVVLVRTRVVLLGARDEEQNVCEALDRIDVPAHHHISAVQCSAAMQSACWQSIGQQPTLVSPLPTVGGDACE